MHIHSLTYHIANMRDTLSELQPTELVLNQAPCITQYQRPPRLKVRDIPCLNCQIVHTCEDRLFYFANFSSSIMPLLNE